MPLSNVNAKANALQGSRIFPLQANAGAAPKEVQQTVDTSVCDVRERRSRKLRVAVKSKSKTLIFDTDEITAAEARGNHVLLRLKSGTVSTRESLNEITAKLSQCGFLRVHRSHLINANEVQEVLPLPTGEYLLKLKDGKDYTVSRTYKQNIRLLAQVSIGYGNDVID